RARPGRPGRAGRAVDPGLQPRRRPRDLARGRPPVRDRAVTAQFLLGPTSADAHRENPGSHARTFRVGSGQRSVDVTERLPIGVSIRTIRAEPSWWLESAKRLD